MFESLEYVAKVLNEARKQKLEDLDGWYINGGIQAFEAATKRQEELQAVTTPVRTSCCTGQRRKCRRSRFTSLAWPRRLSRTSSTSA